MTEDVGTLIARLREATVGCRELSIAIPAAIGFVWNGICSKDHPAGQWEHPDEKPVSLLEWCLSFFPSAQTILDPFMGSGTTGVACVNLGRNFTGIEIEPKYFDTACRRISTALSQPRLFEEPKAPAQKPASLFDEAAA